jgi:hypothetical protein
MLHVQHCLPGLQRLSAVSGPQAPGAGTGAHAPGRRIGGYAVGRVLPRMPSLRSGLPQPGEGLGDDRPRQGRTSQAVHARAARLVVRASGPAGPVDDHRPGGIELRALAQADALADVALYAGHAGAQISRLRQTQSADTKFLARRKLPGPVLPWMLHPLQQAGSG